jgi:hypothetical protein
VTKDFKIKMKADGTGKFEGMKRGPDGKWYKVTGKLKVRRVRRPSTQYRSMGRM